METSALSADAVLRCHEGRSIVLLNTVGRAQAMYTELRQAIEAKGLDIPTILLHSRFFKEDRRAKEERLRSLFGRGTKGPAILVATQVIEAGLDLSCEHLHTELCPMNSLIQRGGRCARFAGDMFKHILVEHLVPLLQDAGQPLSPGAAVYNADRINTHQAFVDFCEKEVDFSQEQYSTIALDERNRIPRGRASSGDVALGLRSGCGE
jgi:CRISPR-associated helicase Cas3